MTDRKHPSARASSPDDGDGARVFVDDRDVRARVLIALSRIGVSLRASAWGHATPRGLNPTQTQILAVLGRNEPRGLRLGKIAEELAVTPPTASDSVTALVEKGLVEKRANPEDQRSIAVVLTDEGRVVAADLAEWPDSLLATVEALTDTEEAVLLRALMKLIRELQRTGQIAPARICVTCAYFRPDVHPTGPPHHCAFVDAPFGDANLRFDCSDHAPAEPARATAGWAAFAGSG